MTKIEIFLLLLLLEIIALVLMLITLIVERIAIFFLKKSKRKKIHALSDMMIERIQHPSTHKITLASKFQKPFLLLEALTTFDHKFQGGRWKEIKTQIMKKYILPKARRWAKSLFWKRRFFAAKAFALMSEPADLHLIHRLVKDPSFLIEIGGALALIKVEDIDGITALLHKMSTASTYTQIYLKDIFLQGSNQVFVHIQKILEHTKSREIQISCLHILASKQIPVNGPMITKGAHSTDAQIRLACITLHGNNPQENSEEILQRAILDPLDDIRKQACHGLVHYPAVKNQKLLEKTLSDTAWFVRLEAARSLKKMGKQGLVILKDHADGKAHLAKQVSSYVLHFNTE